MYNAVYKVNCHVYRKILYILYYNYVNIISCKIRSTWKAVPVTEVELPSIKKE